MIILCCRKPLWGAAWVDKRVKSYHTHREPMPRSMGKGQEQVVARRVERSRCMLRYLGVESTQFGDRLGVGTGGQGRETGQE